jgi:hypothetical protein
MTIDELVCNKRQSFFCEELIFQFSCPLVRVGTEDHYHAENLEQSEFGAEEGNIHKQLND